MDSDEGPAGPVDAPQDLAGCFTYALRLGGCMSILYIIMAGAILFAAITSLFFFR